MRFLRTDSIRRWTDGDYSVTTDPAAVDREVIHRFLAEESYWARERPRELTEAAIDVSRPYTLQYDPAGAQVGFARVVTDGMLFAWIGDVFVLPAHRGGQGTFLLSCIMEDLAPVRRVTLGTEDAQTFYARFGFTYVREPDRWMERVLPHPG